MGEGKEGGEVMEGYRVTKEELFEEVKAWQSRRKKKNYDPNKLGLLWMKMVKNLLNCPSYSGYPLALKEDMESSAYRYCMYAVKSFKCDRINSKSSVFSYFTAAILSGFKNVLKKHYQQVNLKRELYEMMKKNQPVLNIRKEV